MFYVCFDCELEGQKKTLERVSENFSFFLGFRDLLGLNAYYFISGLLTKEKDNLGLIKFIFNVIPDSRCRG